MSNHITTVDDTAEEYRADIRQYAEEAFKDHQIKLLSTDPFKSFYCGRPGTGSYHFYVMFPPYAVIIYGDIGELILKQVDRCNFGWLRGACKDPRYSYYPLSKAVASMRGEVFLEGEARKILEDMKAPIRNEDTGKFETNPEAEAAKKIYNDVFEWGFASKFEWDKAVWEHLEDSEGYSSVTDNDIGTLYCFHALCWFVKNVEEIIPQMEVIHGAS